MQDLRRPAGRSRIRSGWAFKNRPGASHFACGFSCDGVGSDAHLCDDRVDFQSHRHGTEERKRVGITVVGAEYAAARRSETD